MLHPKITLKDISKDTGLSISTVSRVLRGEGKTSQANEQVIMESAQRLGYPLQLQVTPLEYRKDIFIAVITNVKEGEFYTSFFNGFHEASKKSNIHFSLFSIEDVEIPVHEFIVGLQKRFDAAILFLPSLTSNAYKEIMTRLKPEFPIISTASILNPVLDTVSFDGYGGGHLVAEHFYKQEYASVGIINGPKNKLEARFRSNGFLDYIHSQSVMKLVWEFDGDYSVESGQQAYLSYKAASVKPRAIFFSNDSMLFGFLEWARADGLNIPNELALVGYDDLPMCKTYKPQISSVNTDFKTLGSNVIRIILDRLQNPIKHQGVLNLIPVSLNIRESS